MKTRLFPWSPVALLGIPAMASAQERMPYKGAGAVGADVGVFRDNGNSVGDSETKVGGTVFGGVEFFTSNTFAVKGDVRYHIVSKVTDFNPSGLAFTIGVKSYF